MRVRTGWSGEIEPNVWVKVDVDLDETDLRRILITAKLAPELADILSTTVVFQLLEAEAECLIIAKLVARYGQPVENVAEKLSAHRRTKEKIIAAIKADHPPVGDG